MSVNIKALEWFAVNREWPVAASCALIATPHGDLDCRKDLYEWCRDLMEDGYLFDEPFISANTVKKTKDGVTMYKDATVAPQPPHHLPDSYFSQAWQWAIDNRDKWNNHPDGMWIDTPSKTFYLSNSQYKELFARVDAGYKIEEDAEHSEWLIRTSFGLEMYAPNMPVEPTENKYHRRITVRGTTVTVDVYDVLKAFNVTDPALQHLVKKALCCGLRGHKDRAQDLQDILDSAQRAKELHNAVE